MDRESEIYGTQAKVFIQYKGTLQELGLKIEAGLNIPELQYGYMEYEPYDLFGSAEILGFEIELQKMRDDKWPDYQYCLTAMTTDSFEEIMDDRMFDISLWMARYLSLMCKVNIMAEQSDQGTGISFYWNTALFKIESKIIKLGK